MEQIHKNIEGLRDYILELQTNMTSRPAISPELGGKGEYQKSVYLENELKKLGFDEISHIDAPDARAEKGIRPNIVAKYYGQDKTRTFWLLAHMDVVPEGDRSLWKTDPFKLSLEADGDTIHGRGVEDNQQAVTAAFVSV
jgi:succinyl-diaminopimelate desuccinylase